MAQKTTVHLIDDLDGSEAAETVSFALDGVAYAVDLSDEHAAELRADLEPYVAVARKAKKVGTVTALPTRRAGGGRSQTTADREQSRAIRRWARGQGWDVGDRGRIPQGAVDAYHARAVG